MTLNVLWFILVTVLFTGFFFLEGFDYGVGTLLPFVAKDDREKRLVINTIGPHWDGNEVWLLTAGGAIFAAFPNWYATLFSGFYLALFVILLALIMRGVAFEFRSKDEDPRWRAFWDWSLFLGSALPALLWGVAFGNIVRGVPIDGTMTFTGNFFTLLNPYSLLFGLVTLSLFTLHGALFLGMKVEGVVLDRAKDVAKKIVIPVVVLIVAFLGYSFIESDLFVQMNIVQIVGLVLAVAALLTATYMVFRDEMGKAFIGTAVTIVGTTMFLFAGLFPNVMPSSLGEQFNLTIYNASSSPYTLRVMTIVALIFVPIVLGYQAWSYWVFRKRLSTESHLEY